VSCVDQQQHQLLLLGIEQLTELIFLQLSSKNLCGQISSSVFSYSTLDCCLTVGETIMLSTVTVILCFKIVKTDFQFLIGIVD